MPSSDQKADIIKFFTKFILMVGMLAILDQLIGDGFRHYYFRQKSGMLYRTTYTIDSTKADLLIFGSSRASHHYIPMIFKNELHLSSYNSGRDGCDLIYYAGAISAILHRYTPKHIIIDLLPNELSFTEGSKYAPLLPYHDNPVIDSFIKSNSKTEKYKLLSRIYPYNSLFATIISGNKSNYDHDDQGYIELDKTMEPHKRELFKQGKIIPGRVSLLDDLLTKLSKRKINTTLVISPAHYLFANNDTSVKIFKNLTHRFKNITFINYENDPRFSGDSLYQDAYHLNNSGAIKFSKDLADKLAADHH